MNIQIIRNYADLRRETYLPLPEQLDLQWHDLQNGTTLWQDHIDSVKVQYPKPTE
jgi:hypothetical protein